MTLTTTASIPIEAHLGRLASTTAPGEAALLGTDLAKDRRRLVAAHDDAAAELRGAGGHMVERWTGPAGDDAVSPSVR